MYGVNYHVRTVFIMSNEAKIAFIKAVEEIKIFVFMMSELKKTLLGSAG